MVATNVGGIPDVLRDPEAGSLVPAKDPRALAKAIVAALGKTWDPEAVKATGPGTWKESAANLSAVLEGAYAGARRPR